MAQEALITDYFYGVNPSDSTIFTVPSRFGPVKIYAQNCLQAPAK